MTATITTQTITQTTTAIDSVEWAWTEIASAVIASEDAAFYAEHRDAIDQAAHHALSGVLVTAWRARGFTDMADVPASAFSALLNSAHLPGPTVANETTYFEVWEAAAAEMDLTGLAEAAGLYGEYRSSEK